MEAVGQLAGGVAHDFNNLLTVIGGYGEIARRRIGAGPGANELAEVERATQRATQLTRQLLAFSRQQVLDPVVARPQRGREPLVPMLRRLIGEDIEIAMLAANEPAAGASPTAAQLEQVIVNLAVNARDAMPTGGTLTVETRAVVARRRGVRVPDRDRHRRRHGRRRRSSTSSSRSSPPRRSATAPASAWRPCTASSRSPAARSTSTPSPSLGTSFKIYLPVGEDVAPAAPARPETDGRRPLRHRDRAAVRGRGRRAPPDRGAADRARLHGPGRRGPRAALELATERAGTSTCSSPTS